MKVGIADSFHYDIGQTKFIVRYHQIQINATDLKDSVAIILDPLPTCNTASSYDECTKLKSGFNCAWCHSVSRCSDGIDRHRQEWVEANCSRKEKPQKEGQTAQKDPDKTLQIVIPIVVICSVLLILVGVWVVYARAHPNTASGQWLIENRPSQIKKKISDRFSNISFSKDSETGDRIRIA